MLLGLSEANVRDGSFSHICTTRIAKVGEKNIRTACEPSRIPLVPSVGYDGHDHDGEQPRREGAPLWRVWALAAAKERRGYPPPQTNMEDPSASEWTA